MDWRQISIILALSALMAGVSSLWSDRPLPASADPWRMEAEAALEGKSFIWVDNRPEEQFQAGHIAGAIHVDPANPDPGLQLLLMEWDPDKPVLVYCSESACDSSRTLASRLRADLGGAEVFWVDGGWEALSKGGNP